MDVAKDPDLKKILFNTVVIEDSAKHSLFFRWILKYFAMQFNLDPLRVMPNITNEENETNCKNDKSRRV